LLVGLTLLVFGLGQPWLTPGRPFQIGPLVGGLFWGFLGFTYGRKWLFNLIDMSVIPVDPQDPVILEATRRAQASLPILWDHLGQNRLECFIKFPIQTRGGLEHTWGIVHSRVEDQAVVSLANESVERMENPTDHLMVQVKDIEDWQVVVSPTEIRGGYSVGALAMIAKARGYSLSRADRKKLEAFVDARPV
jgi:hypothetical protein